MGSVTSLIQQVLLLGLVLLNLGKLPQVTFWLAQEVAKAQSKPFSLTKFNRALVHGGVYDSKK